MRPQTAEEVFGTYVKGTMMNLRERKFKKAGTDISRILEVATQDSDEEEHARAAPPSSWQAGTQRPCSVPTFSSSPKSVEQWQPAGELWKSISHQLTNYTQRMEAVWDSHPLEDNLKAHVQQRRGNGPRTRAGSTQTPKYEWNSRFLKNDDNKKELISFISRQICK